MELTIRYKKSRKISDGLSEHVHHKLEKIAKYLESDHPVHLVLSSEKDGEHSELSFHFKGHDIIAKEISKNLYEAIDKSIKHGQRQLEKVLKKSKSHRRHEGIKDLEVIDTVETSEDGEELRAS